MKKFLLVGVSHKTAPLEWRECLAVPEERLAPLVRRLLDGGAISEAVVLSTCNRVEAYAVAEGAGAEGLIRRELASVHGDAVSRCFYSKEDAEAVRHLFRVTAGLDSLVVGESEILGQVKRAYEAARAARSTGKLTNVLFQRAMYVGKAVRSETLISEGPTSAASQAVALAQRIFGNLAESSVLLVGAGQMAEAAAHALKSQKVPRLSLVNRTFEKAEALAKQFGGRAAPFDDLPAELAAADIVLFSTGAPEPILSRAQAEEAMRLRRGKPLFLIDIAVPRDVDPAVHRLENVYLYNIDDLESIVAESVVRRRGEIEKADALVDGRVGDFSAWFEAWKRGETASLRHSQRPQREPLFAREAE